MPGGVYRDGFPLFLHQYVVPGGNVNAITVRFFGDDKWTHPFSRGDKFTGETINHNQSYLRKRKFCLMCRPRIVTKVGEITECIRDIETPRAYKKSIYLAFKQMLIIFDSNG